MSKMADLEIEIIEMLSQDKSPMYIARMLDIPLTWVYNAMSNENDVDVELYNPYQTINS